MDIYEPVFQSFSVSAFFGPTALWIFFLILLGCFAIFSSVLIYHWNTYSYNSTMLKKTLAVFFSVSSVFLIALFVSLLTVTF